MHYLIYQITNTKNGKIYIGCHQTTNPDDDYMGSGNLIKAAIKKYGIDSFTKTILHDFDSPEAMFAKEAELVTEEFVKRPDTYNIRYGGLGGWHYAREAASAKLKILFQDKNWMANFKAITSLAQKHRWQKTPCLQEHWIGRKHKPETKLKQSLSHTGKHKGSKNPLFGKKWMTNGTDSKPATKEEQELLLTSGWRYGRIIK